jgi:GrpB-like predicted nucleotidyltransferase (UPF0157 family)
MNIDIVDHDPVWVTEFLEIAIGLRKSLGRHALRIDHIGSTSVPRLVAKDIIDIQVTVRDLDEVTMQQSPVAAGLRLRDDIDRDHQPPGRTVPADELRKVYATSERINCHVRREGAFNQRYALSCRDYLRTHPQSAAAYEVITRQLAAHVPNDFEAYYDIKDPVFDIIMEGAYAWAAATNWNPGPTDV